MAPPSPRGSQGTASSGPGPPRVSGVLAALPRGTSLAGAPRGSSPWAMPRPGRLARASASRSPSGSRCCALTAVTRSSSSPPPILRCTAPRTRAVTRSACSRRESVSLERTARVRGARPGQPRLRAPAAAGGTWRLAGRYAASDQRPGAPRLEAMPEFIYQMRAVRKAHADKVILDEVTLAFLPGAKIGVVGPNGTGKSTLLRMMAGVEQPSNGEARLMPGFTVGLLAQEPMLDESKTVLGNVEDGVAATKALLQQPDLLLLDEPTNHLDAESVLWLEQHLEKYPGTVVAVTHDRYFLDNVAGWILELDRGHAYPYEATTRLIWRPR